jgi:hypothetical protein
VATPPATNNDGSTVTGIITPLFNPLSLEIPLPNTLARSGTTDFTLNLSSGTNFGDPLVALSALDGWSTTEKWVASFVEEEIGLSDIRPPANINATTVIPGATVRFFEVVVDLAGQTGVTGAVVAVNRELTPGVDYVAVASGSNVAIIPLRPLKELTGYMAVLTEGIKDADGNNSTADLFYHAAKRTEPLVDASGSSTDPLLSDAIANAAEPLRKIVNTHLAAAASMGMDPDTITLSWTAVTQSIKVVTTDAAGPDHGLPDRAEHRGLRPARPGGHIDGRHQPAVLPGPAVGSQSHCAADHLLAGCAGRLRIAVRRVGPGPDLHPRHGAQPDPRDQGHADRAAADQHAERGQRLHQARRRLAGGDLQPRDYGQPGPAAGRCGHAGQGRLCRHRDGFTHARHQPG